MGKFTSLETAPEWAKKAILEIAKAMNKIDKADEELNKNRPEPNKSDEPLK